MTWNACENYYDKMTRTGVVKSMKDFCWDIRPKPEFGTPPTLGKAAALAGYVQSLAGLALLREDMQRDHNDVRWLRERQSQERLLVEVIRQAAGRFRAGAPA